MAAIGTCGGVWVVRRVCVEAGLVATSFIGRRKNRHRGQMRGGRSGRGGDYGRSRTESLWDRHVHRRVACTVTSAAVPPSFPVWFPLIPRSLGVDPTVLPYQR
eukprot:2041159-Pleurochrysis_carterae.AAC.3